MYSEGLDEIDYAQTLHMALSQLDGNAFPMETDDSLFEDGVQYPKPTELTALADVDDSDGPPPTTSQIIQEITANLDNYPKTLQILMQRGFLKKKQQCKKCDRKMHLRRRKTCYEWRCRTRDKRGDCSSCSIKTGSWFESTKLSFKIIFNFLAMHCKNYPTSMMANVLKQSTHAISEARRLIYDLTDGIVRKYPTIGTTKTEIYVEVISLQSKVSREPAFKVLAGQEIGSSRCFAHVLTDWSPRALARIKAEKIGGAARVTMVQTVKDNHRGTGSSNALFFDEENCYPLESDRFFTNIRQCDPDSTREALQSWLNDLVIRRTEGAKMVEKCVEEMRDFLK